MSFSILPGCAQSPSYDGGLTPIKPTLRQWQPASAPKGVVLALHSFGDYGAAFNRVGPLFAQSGYYLESYDQAGFGERRQADRWPGEAQLVQEASQRIQHLYSVYQQPVYVLGESLGGAVAILAALEKPDQVAGIILVGPAVREGIRWRYGWNAAIATAAALAPGYRLTVERDPRDPALAPHSAARLAEDPLVMRQVRMDSYWGLIRIADSASDQAPALSTPVLLLYGGNDRSVPEAGIQALQHHLDNQLTYIHVPQGPHLLLQGAQWQTTAGRILNWMQSEKQPRDQEIGLTSPLQPATD